jgi:hypothetical protein
MGETMSFGLALAIGTIPVLCFALGYLCGRSGSKSSIRGQMEPAKAYGAVDCEPEY